MVNQRLRNKKVAEEAGIDLCKYLYRINVAHTSLCFWLAAFSSKGYDFPGRSIGVDQSMSIIIKFFLNFKLSLFFGLVWFLLVHINIIP